MKYIIIIIAIVIKKHLNGYEHCFGLKNLKIMDSLIDKVYHCKNQTNYFIMIMNYFISFIRKQKVVIAINSIMIMIVFIMYYYYLDLMIENQLCLNFNQLRKNGKNFNCDLNSF